MTISEAIQRARAEFPFEGYIDTRTTPNAYCNIADVTLRHVRTGGTILDFGCGPCDKTAVLQLLGFRCSGYDDLQDDWHHIPGNREKILSFAGRCGIDFRQAATGQLPFAKAYFDMIMLHDVLEHLHDSPRDLLNDLLELAKPNGLLFVTIPNAANIRKRIDVLRGKTNLPPFNLYYWRAGPWRGHVREYVKDDLVKLSQYLNLETLELRTCDHMLQKVPGKLLPAYRIATSIFPGWKDTWLLVARKRDGWQPRKTLFGEERAAMLGQGTRYRHTE